MARWTVDAIPPLHGKCALITGANGGLGYESALALAKRGAQLIMAVRNMKKGEEARAAILQQVPTADLRLIPLDLGNLATVRAAAAEVARAYDRIDILMNNAGVMGTPRRTTADGFEMQIGVNHLGHFALTGLLLPLVRKAAAGRIVTVSSVAMFLGKIELDDLNLERRYSRYGAYGQSKLANALFAFELQRLLTAAGAAVLSVPINPGFAYTSLQTTAMKNSRALLDNMVYPPALNLLAKSQAKGALPQLYAATAPEVQAGDFISSSVLHTRGFPKKMRAARRAYDEQVARRLWELSEALTGVHYDELT